MKDIVAYIKRLRIEKGYTIGEFSQEIGFSSQTGYQKIESGQTDLKMKHLFKIAEVLEVRPEELLGIETKSQNNEDTEFLKQYIRRLKNDLASVTFQYRNLYYSYQFLDKVFTKFERTNSESYEILQETMLELKDKVIQQNLKELELTEFSGNEEKEEMINHEKDSGEKWKKLSPKETTTEVLLHHTTLKDMFDQVIQIYLEDKDNKEKMYVWKKIRLY